MFEPAPGDDRDASFATLHGLYWLMLNLAADRPLVLAVDDLHWCDRPSLRFLAYLTRRLEGLPILLAVTARSTEPGTDPALLSEIAADLATSPVRPGPLTGAAVGRARPRVARARRRRRVLRRRARGDRRQPAADPPAPARPGDRGRAARTRRSAGIVREIGPGAIARTVLLRLARQPPEALAVARAVAVLGEGASLPAVAALAEVDEAALARAAAVLARTEILRPEPPLGFVHALVRDAVYREMPHGERALWHERAVRVLQALGAPAEPGRGAAAVRAARGRTPPSPRCCTTRAAPRSRAARRTAPSGCSPARWPSRRPRSGAPAVLLDLGLSEMLVDGPAAVGHLRAAYEAIPDPVARAQIAIAAHADAHFHRRRPRSPYAVADAVARGAARRDRDRRRRRLEAELGRDPVGRRRPEQLHALDALTAGLDEPGPGARMVEAMVALRLAFDVRPVEDVLPLLERAYGDGTLLEDDDGLFTVVVLLVYALADRDEALGVADDMLARAHLRGSQFGMLAVSLWRGWLHLRRGELVDAVGSLQQALDELAAWHGAAGGDVYAAALHAHALLEHGDLDAAWRASTRGCATRSGRRSRPPAGGRAWSASCSSPRAAPAEVLALTAELRTRHRHARNPTAMSWHSPEARALHALGRTERGAGARRGGARARPPFGAPSAVSRALRELGEIRGDAGIPDARGRRGRRRGHAGAARARQGARRPRPRAAPRAPPADAREPLRRALELADACGAAGPSPRTSGPSSTPPARGRGPRR